MHPPAKPFLISFSGIDGAGKSTQIALLQAALHNMGLNRRLITFWDDVVAFKSVRESASHRVFKGDQGVGAPDRPIQRHDKDVKSPLLTAARMVFYFFDVISLRRILRRFARRQSPGGTDVVIFDRYIYDEIANLPANRPWSRLYARFLLRLSPRPDVSFVLDANPDAAYARKPEYSLEFLHLNRAAYLHLAKAVGMTTIATAPIHVAHAQILQHVLRMRNAPQPENQATGHMVDSERSAA
jgi:thymidylate kinase